jgi:SAM-dependent methyltransferase
MLIQGDPNDARFYRAAGGEPAGSSPSASIPGRVLPLFRIKLKRSAAHVDEPLADSAMLAWQWSQSSCRENGEDHDCAWYHGSWQILRLLGVFNSIKSDDDFFLSQLDAAIAGGARRFLVSGAADYALLARIAVVAASRSVTPKITVVDRCETPLQLNRWYADRVGLDIDTLCADILEYRAPSRFDVTCTHSFMCFFDTDVRKKLVANWWDCLAPGGAVLTAQRVRPDDKNPHIGYSSEQVAELGERAYNLAEKQFAQHGLEPNLARMLAEGYATHHWTYLIRQADELRQLFESQGFELEHFAPPGKGQLEADTPGTPVESDTSRWRILARKP